MSSLDALIAPARSAPRGYERADDASPARREADRDAFGRALAATQPEPAAETGAADTGGASPASAETAQPGASKPEAADTTQAQAGSPADGAATSPAPPAADAPLAATGVLLLSATPPAGAQAAAGPAAPAPAFPATDGLPAPAAQSAETVPSFTGPGNAIATSPAADSPSAPAPTAEPGLPATDAPAAPLRPDRSQIEETPAPLPQLRASREGVQPETGSAGSPERPTAPQPAAAMRTAEASAPAPAAQSAPGLAVSDAAPAPGGSSTVTASGVTGSMARAEGAPASASQASSSGPPGAVLQVYSRIVERMDGRAQRFDVRLEPEELGRVDVRIEIGADKKVHATLAVHDAAAYSDLSRHARALEQSLAQAGVELAEDGLRLTLTGESGGGLQDRPGSSPYSGDPDSPSRRSPLSSGRILDLAIPDAPADGRWRSGRAPGARVNLVA